MGERAVKQLCKWCASGNSPEWSKHAYVWIHRGATIDKACLNQEFSTWWEKTGQHIVMGPTNEEIFNAGWNAAILVTAALDKETK